ncbi:hypothetical protein CBS101457_005340 [Exobasidium rhododendri]|nr:hypothetical protein CBS101457_005340 [Exobasidium rhododendri]
MINDVTYSNYSRPNRDKRDVMLGYRTGKYTVKDAEGNRNEATPYYKSSSNLTRAAIQLRPFLERLYQTKRTEGPLTGEDITTYANSDYEENLPPIKLEWSEDFAYKEEELFYMEAFRYQSANDLNATYKKWLQDPDLAHRVAQSFNEGREKDGVYPTKLGFKTNYSPFTPPALFLDYDRFFNSTVAWCNSNFNTTNRRSKQKITTMACYDFEWR